MKSGYKLLWTPRADSELDEVISYLEENWSEKEIHNLAIKLDDVLEIIANNPYVFQVSDLRYDIRRAVVAKYNSLYYRINGNYIEILSFYNNRKNPHKRKLK